MTNRIVRIPVTFAAIALLVPLWMASTSSTPTAKSFTGEVTDSICAQNGSHDTMMAKMKSMGSDKETCTKKCAEIGGKYVLYDEASKNVFIMDDQEKAKTFAGHRVRVAGTVAGNHITVTNVEPIG